MVKLRLKRMGSKYNAFYRIVVADSRSPRDGKYIEELGFYNPHTKEIKVNNELREKWMSQGAVPSETVKKLFAKLDKEGNNGDVVSLPKKVKKIKKTAPEITEEIAKEETPESTEKVVEESTEKEEK